MAETRLIWLGSAAFGRVSLRSRAQNELIWIRARSSYALVPDADNGTNNNLK
jgi:hypothetical protein